ncbi:MAG: tRNA (cytidine(34)-2'-O)-methyltransferase [Cyanobacteria bacterium P01_F01_bin.143]
MRVVLVYPQIPPNTGNIARTCAATKTELHLVAPLGFELSDRYLKRAGLDYWPYVDLHYHSNLEDFWRVQRQNGGKLIGFTVRGSGNYLDYQYQENDWLLFGSETAGLPTEVLELCDYRAYIAIAQPEVRSLNLSVSVSVGLFEALRQLRN